MRKKERVDYIYLCQSAGKRNCVEFVREDVAGIQVLKVRSIHKDVLNADKIRKEDKHKAVKRRHDFLTGRLEKGLRKYDVSSCVINADERMAKEFQLEQALFQARKKELLEHRRAIIGKFASIREGKPGNRKQFLVVVDSGEWKQKDLLFLFLEAKNYFEDLCIVVKNDTVQLERLVEILYEEWGIVLHKLSEGEAMARMMNCVFFLLSQWTNKIRTYGFYSGYVISENDTGIRRCEGGGKLYSGLVYAIKGERIPYAMAVSIFHQNRELYEKFAITFVDIYHAE